MTDNTQINAMATSGDVIATDDIAGVKYQRMKLSIGQDGSAADAPGDTTDGYYVQVRNNTGMYLVHATDATAAFVQPKTGATWKLASNTGVDIGDVDILNFPTMYPISAVDASAAYVRPATGVTFPITDGARINVYNSPTSVMFIQGVITSQPAQSFNLVNSETSVLYVQAVISSQPAQTFTLLNSATSVMYVGGTLTVNPVVVTSQPRTVIDAAAASALYVQPGTNATWKLASNPAVYVGAVSDTGNIPAIPGVSAQINTTGDVPLNAAAGAGLRWYLTNVLVTNPHATVGTLVTIKDNSAFNYVSGYAVGAGGGFSMNFHPEAGSAMVNGRIFASQQSTAGVFVSIAAVAKP